MKNNKKIYITWFLIIVLPSIFIRLAIYLGEMEISEDLVVLLTFVSKFGMLVVTIWYGLKIRFGKFWAWAIGISTLLPFMAWISLLILLTRDREATAKLKEDKTQAKAYRANIKDELEKVYISVFEGAMGLPSHEAKKTFNELYNQVVEESKKKALLICLKITVMSCC